MVASTPEKIPCYPFDKRLDGLRSSLKNFEERKFLTLPGLEL
jgi:hypothetical protein